jgi:hypothetical protein
MAWYRIGTVAVTNGSKTVTGTGTVWAANVQAGDAFIGPDGAYNEIDLVNSNTSITLVENYAGTTVASGGAYKIIPTQGRVRDLAAQVAQLIVDYGEVESALTVDSGRVGLGKTPNASAKLDVAGQVWVDAPSGDATLRMLTSGTEKGKLAVTSAGRAYIESNGAEVMTWLNGNVGVGISPVHRFTLYTPGATAGYMQFTNGSTGPAIGNGLLLGVDASGNAVINHQGASSLRVSVAGAERLQIKATGQARFMPLSSDPGGGQGGDLYFNSTTSKFRGHTGSAWVDLH